MSMDKTVIYSFKSLKKHKTIQNTFNSNVEQYYLPAKHYTAMVLEFQRHHKQLFFHMVKIFQ